MNPSDLVQEIGRRLNLTGLSLTEGVCRLVFDHHLHIDLEDDGQGRFFFHTVLAPLPHAGNEALLSALLSAHLFGLDTDGCTFGVHPQTRDLFLFRMLDVAALDTETALHVLERFTQQAENWKTKIQELIRETSSAAPVLEAPDSGIRA